MRRLTYTQTDHLCRRLHETLSALAAKEIEKLGPAPKRLKYSDLELLTMIRNGKAKLKPALFEKGEIGLYLVNAFDFPTTAAMRKSKIAYDEFTQKVREIQSKRESDYTRMVDEVMLGDSAEALRMLRDLEARLTP